jgi:hypothetical protein
VDVSQNLLVKGPARRMLRQSFYSGKPEHNSRNLKRASESADSMEENHPQHHRILRGNLRYLILLCDHQE